MCSGASTFRSPSSARSSFRPRLSSGDWGPAWRRRCWAASFRRGAQVGYKSQKPCPRWPEMFGRWIQFLITSASGPVLYMTGAALLVFIGLFFVVQVPSQYLIRNLTVRWRTTAMTALAFVLVISLLTVMMAFVNGMDKLTRSSGRPGNVMILADGATDE